MDKNSDSLCTQLELVTDKELAAHLKICRRLLDNWRVAGLIPYFKLGKAVRYRLGAMWSRHWRECGWGRGEVGWEEEEARGAGEPCKAEAEEIFGWETQLGWDPVAVLISWHWLICPPSATRTGTPYRFSPVVRRLFMLPSAHP